ncbi:hypothetical protein ACQUSY_10085 [Microbacterium sp. YY-03]|uniref:hypothetical protein n=1 Tax=Microbacterium sp. YY-03 TaxID=3421636 RepID=UPI003D16B998
MSDLADAVSRAVFEHAGLAPAAPTATDETAHQLTADESLALIGASAAAERQAATVFHGAVTAARAANVSWARIGGELGMTRQAAQQRFGIAPENATTDHTTNDNTAADHTTHAFEDTERWLGPVTAFDEMKELELAGRAGWHTVEAGAFKHRMVRTETQWQHRRVLWRGSLARDEADGWQIGCRAFPWIYLIRDTGIPIEA